MGSRGFVSVVASVAVVALVASGTGPAAAASGAVVRAAASADWDPQSVEALPVLDATQGPVVPVYSHAVVTPSQGMAVSVEPTLSVPDAPDQQMLFTVMTAGAKTDTPVWSGQSGTNRKQVPAGVLVQGRTYLWQAQLVSGEQTVFGPFAMSVDVVRPGIQPTQSVGPFSVDLASGAVSVAASLRSVAGASGALGVTFHHDGLSTDPGLAPGWTMSAAGQSWESVRVNSDESVELVSASGEQYAFVPTAGSQAFRPMLAAGRVQATGSEPALARNEDGSYTATMPSGQVSVFEAPGEDGVGFLAESFNGVAAGPVFDQVGGRIVSVTDGIAADQSVTVQYAGSGSCPDVPTSLGFVDPADGAVCAVRYPDDSSVSFFYQQTSQGTALLSRMVDYPDTSDGKASVTDFQWDQSGRVVGVRSPLAGSALASGVRTDTDAVMSTLTYDAQGRVATVTKAAALAGDPRASYAMDYSTTGRAKVTAVGAPETTMGFLVRYDFDPATFLVSETIDSKGKSASQTWDENSEQVTTTTGPTGLKTSTEYDADGTVSAVTGPWPSTSTGSNVPRQEYIYDHTVADDGSLKAMHGTNVTYWSNPSLTGAPARREYGPKFGDPATIPSDLRWTWEDNPAGGSDGWGARILGEITLPGDGTDPMDYKFKTVSGGTTLWIDNEPCEGGNGECVIALTPGQHRIRIDRSVMSQGSAPVEVQWQVPGSGSFELIPMSALVPGYGLAAQTTAHEALSVNESTTSTALSQYAQPWNGQATATWNKAESSVRNRGEFEPFDPAQGQFARPTQMTLPAGNTLNAAYYGADEAVAVPCAGMGTITQYGLPKAITRQITADRSTNTGGVQTAQTFHDIMGRTIASTVAAGESGEGGSAMGCTYINDAGQVDKTVVPARGEQGETTTENITLVDGSPLKSRTTVSVDGGPTYTSSGEVDLFGRTVRSTDTWGTVTAATYDPYSGNPLSTTVLTARGPRSVVDKKYTADGDLIEIRFNGDTIATLSIPNAGGNTVTYDNGVSVKIAPNTTGNFGSQTWTTADQKTFSYKTVTSPTQRILEENLDFGPDTATFHHTYDPLGRLTQSMLDTTMSTDHDQWAYEYDVNSNRSKQTVDGTNVTTYDYNGDQLLTTTDPIMDTITYSDRGEMTTLGPLSIDYTQDGFTAAISDSATGDSTTYRRANGAVMEKVATTNGVTSSSRYTAGGIILDANNTPQWQSLSLPGGTTILRDLTAGSVNPAKEYLHNTVRGQRMWTSTPAGTATTERFLYSPFGETLNPVTKKAQKAQAAEQATTPDPAVTPEPTEPAATPTPDTPTPSQSSPASPSDTTGPSPTETDTARPAPSQDAVTNADPQASPLARLSARSVPPAPPAPNTAATPTDAVSPPQARAEITPRGDNKRGKNTRLRVRTTGLPASATATIRVKGKQKKTKRVNTKIVAPVTLKKIPAGKYRIIPKRVTGATITTRPAKQTIKTTPKRRTTVTIAYPPAPDVTPPPQPDQPAPGATPPPQPDPPASGAALKPNYQWQGGNSLETENVAALLPTIDMGARLYVPSLGKFTSTDPAIQGSATAYDYGNQDPINNTDLSGNMSQGLKWALSGLIAVVATAIAVFVPGAIVVEAGVESALGAGALSVAVATVATVATQYGEAAFLTAVDGHLTKADALAVEIETIAVGVIGGLGGAYGTTVATARNIALTTAFFEAQGDAAAAEAANINATIARAGRMGRIYLEHAGVRTEGLSDVEAWDGARELRGSGQYARMFDRAEVPNSNYFAAGRSWTRATIDFQLHFLSRPPEFG